MAGRLRILLLYSMGRSIGPVDWVFYGGFPSGISLTLQAILLFLNIVLLVKVLYSIPCMLRYSAVAPKPAAISSTPFVCFSRPFSWSKQVSAGSAQQAMCRSISVVSLERLLILDKVTSILQSPTHLSCSSLFEP